MLFAEAKFLPDLRAASFDEVLAVGIGRLVVDDELDDLVGPVSATMLFDQAIDRRSDLQQPGTRPVFNG